MKALFVRESGAGYLLLALAISSSLVLIVESNTRLLEPVRSGIGAVVSPIYFVAEAPYLLSDNIANLFSTRNRLLDEIAQLERSVLELSQVSQQFLAMQTENERLRELLGSRSRLSGEVLVAELVAVIPDTKKHRVVIDKGANDGVSVGESVIDADGLFGQVIEVSEFTSIVLQISDTTHAVPVEVNRNNVRAIAAGTGEYDVLELETVPKSADIRQGDLLVSSGLGDRFPRGYPVGTVTGVDKDPTAAFARVTVRPSAALDRSRHVLVVFRDLGEAAQ